MADDLGRRAARSMGWLAFEKWLSRLFSLAVLGILVRLLDADSFGLVASAVSITLILQVFVDTGFSRCIVQFKELPRGQIDTAFWTGVGVAALLTTGIALAAPAISKALGYGELTPILRALSLSLPVAALSLVPASLLERELEFRALALRQVAATLVGGAAGVGSALCGAGIWALVVQSLSASLVAVAILWRSTDWRPRWHWSRADVRLLLKAGLPILAIDLLDALQNNLDKLVIATLFAPAQLGYYFMGQRLVLIVSDLVVAVVSRVSLPTFSRVQDDLDRLNQIFRKITFFVAAASIFVFASMAILASPIIDTLFGPEWGRSAVVVQVLAPAWALGSVMVFDRSMFLATSNAGLALRLAILQNAVGVALLFTFAPLGIVGIAFSKWALVLLWPVRLWLLRSAAGVDVSGYAKQIATCLLAMAPAAPLGLWLVTQTDWSHWPFGALTFGPSAALAIAMVYLPMLWLLAAKENKNVVRRVMIEVRLRARRIES